jgi:hypothetical protein
MVVESVVLVKVEIRNKTVEVIWFEFPEPIFPHKLAKLMLVYKS